MAAALLFVLAASGQAASPESTLLDRGVLGAFCVILSGAVGILFRLLLVGHERYIKATERITDVLAQNTAALKDAEAAIAIANASERSGTYRVPRNREKQP